MASGKLEILSLNMPLRITIVLPADEAGIVLPQIEEMVSDGIVTVQDIQTRSHKTSRQLIPKHIRVKNVMTASPCKVTLKTLVSQVVELLLSSHFTGMPVVDEKNHPQGVISQGNLIYRAKMPLRLGILASANADRIKSVMQCLSQMSAEKIMTRPAICIREDKLLVEAVDLMLKKSLKRLPLMDRGKKDESANSANRSAVMNKTARDVLNTECITVLENTSIDEAIGIIVSQGIKRLPVLDVEGRFKGLISREALLRTGYGYETLL